jgi:rhamnosyltransferase
MKKIAFYLFYDEQGIVDDYIMYKLKKLKEHVEYIVFIINELLTSENRDKVKRLFTINKRYILCL